jgi:hypothetical protein
MSREEAHAQGTLATLSREEAHAQGTLATMSREEAPAQGTRATVTRGGPCTGHTCHSVTTGGPCTGHTCHCHERRPMHRAHLPLPRLEARAQGTLATLSRDEAHAQGTLATVTRGGPCTKHVSSMIAGASCLRSCGSFRLRAVHDKQAHGTRALAQDRPILIHHLHSRLLSRVTARNSYNVEMSDLKAEPVPKPEE